VIIIDKIIITINICHISGDKIFLIEASSKTTIPNSQNWNNESAVLKADFLFSNHFSIKYNTHIFINNSKNNNPKITQILEKIISKFNCIHTVIKKNHNNKSLKGIKSAST